MFRVFAHAQLCLTVSVKPSVIGDAAAAVVVRLEKRNVAMRPAAQRQETTTPIPKTPLTIMNRKLPLQDKHERERQISGVKQGRKR